MHLEAVDRPSSEGYRVVGCEIIARAFVVKLQRAVDLQQTFENDVLENEI